MDHPGAAGRILRRRRDYPVGPMAKWLITLGIILVALGLLWPLLARLGLGSLPGDIRIERKGTFFYFPLTTSIIVSLVISLILWIFRK
jgi:hypothetical protein